jgi:hypothetical protein
MQMRQERRLEYYSWTMRKDCLGNQHEHDHGPRCGRVSIESLSKHDMVLGEKADVMHDVYGVLYE